MAKYNLLKIVDMYEGGLSGKEIAYKMGLKHSNSIRQILKKNGKLRTQSEASKLAVVKGKKDIAIMKLIECAKTINKNNPEKYRWSGTPELHPRWIEDRSKLKRRPKQSIYWRKSVFERDNYICQDCGQKGGKLYAHHIKPFALFPDLRLDINNGQTLCGECHKATHTYARKISSQLKIYDYAI